MKNLILAALLLSPTSAFAQMHLSPVACVSPTGAFDLTTATVTLETAKDGRLLLGFYGGPVSVIDTENLMTYETVEVHGVTSYRRHLELTKEQMPDGFLRGSFSLDFPKAEPSPLRCRSYPGKRLVRMDVRGKEDEVIDTEALQQMAAKVCGGEAEVAGTFISRFRPIWAIDVSMYVESQAFFCIN